VPKIWVALPLLVAESALSSTSAELQALYPGWLLPAAIHWSVYWSGQ